MRTALTFGLLFAVACSDSASEPEQTASRIKSLTVGKEVAPLFGSVPWVELGPFEVAADDTIDPDRGFDPDSKAELPEDSTAAFVDLASGKRYLALYPEGFDSGHPLVIESRDSDWADWSPEESLLVEKGWADNNGDGVGEDNRIDQTPNIAAQFSRLGRLSTGCTATMINQTANGTFALTNAHCVINQLGNFVFPTFTPAAGKANVAGAWNTIGFIYLNAYYNNACYAATQPDSCTPVDLALLQLTPQSGTTYLGGMPYGTYTQANIQSATFFTSRQHAGYPVCSSVGAPSGCTGTRAWQHPIDFFSTNYRFSDGAFDTNLDTSPGHSGGYVFGTTNSGPPGPILFGIHVGSWCNGNCSGNPKVAFPSLNARFSSTWINIMNDQIFN